jgi:tellurite resistance protein
MSEDLTPSTRDGYSKIPADEAAVLFPALHMAMVMTALADGPLGQNEKDVLVEVFYAGHRGRMSPQAVLTTLQTIVDAIDQNEGHWPKLFQEARRLSGESKIEILRACAKMAHIDDGEMGPKEELRIASIGDLIEISAQDLETWNAEYRRVKEGDA